MAHVVIEDIERYSLFTRIDYSAQAGSNKIVLRACPWNMAGETINLGVGLATVETAVVSSVDERKITLTAPLTYEHGGGEVVFRNDLVGTAMGTLLTALPNLVAPDAGDLLYIVHNPGGSPVDEKLTITNLFTHVPTDSLTVGTDQFKVVSEEIWSTLTETNPLVSVTPSSMVLRYTYTPAAVPIVNHDYKGLDIFAISGANLGNNLCYITGISSVARYDSATNLAALYGISGISRLNGTGTVAYANSLMGQIEVRAAGTITNAVGLRIISAYIDGGGAITNNYGIYIEAQTVGGTRNWGIFNLAPSVLYGKVNIGEVDTPTFAQLQVRQINAGGTIPCVWMYQDDVDEAFIEYYGTIAADQTKSISTINGDGAVTGPKNFSSTAGWEYGGMVKIKVNNTAYWMPYYTPDTA